MERYKRSLLILLLLDLMFLMFMLFFYMKGNDTDHIVKYDNAKFVFDDLSDVQVIPSGEPMGIYLKTDGVMIVDTGDFKNAAGQLCCPADHVLEPGDYIIGINGQKTDSKNRLIELISQSGGKEMQISYIRNDREYETTLLPEQSENGEYMLGLWVKDDISGIGTVTFIMENHFMALGHSVSDNDTGLMVRCSGGGVYTTNITKINKSFQSVPGQLQGSIFYKRDLIGIVEANTGSGIYGYLDADYVKEHYSNEKSMYVAGKEEIECGKAYIYSRLTGELIKYEIEITNLNYDGNSKNIEFEVVDEDLLELTGGVVQGMSGSPIVQNGKLVGAITHVLVDNPRQGYGVFIENMLERK